MMTKELERRLGEAVELAKGYRHEFVTLEHILLALTNSPKTVEVLEACSVDVQRLKKTLREHLKHLDIKIGDEQLDAFGGLENWQPEFSLACHRLIQRASMQVKTSGRSQVTEASLLVAFFYEQESHAVYFLSQQELTQFDLIQYISHGVGKTDENYLPSSSSSEDGSGDLDMDGKPKDESKKSALDQFCVNLNKKALEGHLDPLIGREDVLERVIEILLRRNKNNPLLIGEPGVGKTAIAEGLAQRIANKKVPAKLADKVIYSMEVGTLLAGTKFRGDFESRMKGILKDVVERKNVVLFVDEIHTLVGAGSTSGGSMDASNLLKPALASGEISCIGSTTHTEYRQHFEKDRALNRRFQRVDIKEPSADETIEILKGLAPRFENFHQVTYSDAALRAAAELSLKYIPSKLLPDKAIDVIDETGAHLRMKSLKNETIEIGVPEIESTVARISGVPVASVTANERMQLKDLDKKLKAAIYGQDSAIDKLVTSIKLSRSGLRAAHKPIANFLFVGPTGVGKTEVCKVLSDTLGLPFHRFDMSEYMEKHAVSRLVGAPPGYVGFEQGGLLTEAVNKNPYALILLDEIEKAHPDIFGVLLQVMDAGRLTDSVGREANFSHVVLVMTSNAGAMETAKGNIGLVEQERSLHSMEAIKKTFSPEFINRLDAIVPFHSLNEESLLKVVDKFIDELRMQLALKKVDLQVSLEAKKWLMKKGYEPAYGARPMGRTIEEHLKKPLVEELLFGKIADGGSVTVSLSTVPNKNQNSGNSLNYETLEFHYTPATTATGMPLLKSSNSPADPVNA